LLTASGVTNFVLARRAERLATVVRILKAEGRLREGEVLPPETLTKLDGSSWVLRYGKQLPPTVVYAFSPGCRWCQRNSDTVAVLASQVACRYRFVAVSISPDRAALADYVAQHQVGYPVYLASASFTSDYKVGMTPTTVIADSNGRVVKALAGAYSDDIMREVETELGVHLAVLQDPVRQKGCGKDGGGRGCSQEQESPLSTGRKVP
jgi:hypothetical protein